MNTHIYPILINTCEGLSWLGLEIYEAGYQERLAVDRDVDSH
jgi:hypothetical protein